MIDLFIPVKPVPKERPRLRRGIVYTPAKTAKAERDIGLIMKSYMNKNDIHITCGALVMESLFITADLRQADIDNYVKLVMDALNKIVYEDDRQIVKITAEKRQTVGSEEPGIYLKIRGINEVLL